uniref:Mitochondrial-processing peptidase subunit alpha n=1 Tax=Cacopsylla melanoneura TaxID=428564 RepID=A0A8D8V1Q5_9HEMI
MAGRVFGLRSFGLKSIKGNHHIQSNNFSSEVKPPPPPPPFQQPPLSAPLPGLSKVQYSSVKDNDRNTEVTTLPNGLKVASENRFGSFCTVGVIIDSGSRYEKPYPSGVSHFLEKLAFNSTVEYKNKDAISQTLEKIGGICDCLSSRDTFIYAASAATSGLDTVVKILGDVVLRPKFSEEEMNMARQTIQFELENYQMRPEQETLLMDMIHAAAYKDNTLGLPKLCPSASISVINNNTLFTYLKNYYQPSKMVLAGVGVEHDKLVEAATKYFVDKEPIWSQDKSLVLTDKRVIDTSKAMYTGGFVKEECNIPTFAGTSGLPELSHIVIGLEGVSHQDKDFIPSCVLNILMGGGGSFSAGGPGKGMYTRLYTNVLNRYHWMFSATAYNHAYSDTGLFCIHASAPPSNVKNVVDVIVKELVTMAGPISNDELSRAKKQLQSMLLMNLEARPAVFEDVGRQVLATGHRKRPSTYIEGIENVTADDIRRVASRLLATQPAIAARGDLINFPTFEDIHYGIQNNGVLPRKGRMSSVIP